MGSDDELDTTSRRLLDAIDELRQLEREKRNADRGSVEFNELAKSVEAHARRVFDLARDQRIQGEEDSPIPAEQDGHHPGVWTEGSQN